MKKCTQILISVTVLISFVTMAAIVNAEDLFLYISAYATGDDGAIHAFRLSTDSGELKQVHRTPHVAQAFFMALSRNRKFLYAITAPGEVGGDPEHVAAFEIVDDRELK